MIQHFQIGLFRSPCLTRIHTSCNLVGQYIGATFGESFDNLESTTEYSGHIRSYHNGDEQLLQAKVFHSYSSLGDIRPYPVPPDHVLIEYWTPNRTLGEQLYKRETEETWHDYTDYQGLVVPLKIIERMRAVEGVEKDEWEGRGIQVSDKAWKVLLDWKAEQDEAKEL